MSKARAPFCLTRSLPRTASESPLGFPMSRAWSRPMEALRYE